MKVLCWFLEMETPRNFHCWMSAKPSLSKVVSIAFVYQVSTSLNTWFQNLINLASFKTKPLNILKIEEGCLWGKSEDKKQTRLLFVNNIAVKFHINQDMLMLHFISSWSQKNTSQDPFRSLRQFSKRLI
jgi:hypothetical protein